jgi:hypothetical protein
MTGAQLMDKISNKYRCLFYCNNDQCAFAKNKRCAYHMETGCRVHGNLKNMPKAKTRYDLQNAENGGGILVSRFGRPVME